MSQFVPLPKDFVERINQEGFPPPKLIESLDAEPAVSVRTHPLKAAPAFAESQEIPWSKNGLFLGERPKFTLDPLFHAGCYYPQEAGSQMLDFVLRQLELPAEPIVLDLCAAPGGKSTLISSFLDGSGLLVSNEIVPGRAKILKENTSKWGYLNAIVTQNEPKAFQSCGTIFDLIVTDVPCSGEGMFRKDMNARQEWSTANVLMCARRQEDIISEIWPALKPGGLLVYSTCTFNADENEKNVGWICKNLGGEEIDIDLPWAMRGRGNSGIYAIPGELQTEGFYIAVIRKTSTETLKVKAARQLETSIYPNTDSELGKLVKNLQAVLKWKEYLFAVPEAHVSTIRNMQHQLRVIKMGTELGELTRKEIIPHHDLALSTNLLNDSVPKYELSLELALQYLKGNTFPLEGKSGWGVVAYSNQPLGWIKHLGSRFNNAYPKDWRIRMDVG